MAAAPPGGADPLPAGARVPPCAPRRPTRLAGSGDAPVTHAGLGAGRDTLLDTDDLPEAARTVPPITELTRIEPVYLDRLEKQGIFTTGILLEVSETATRRQYLADHVRGTLEDVSAWRDEALMLNLA